MKRFITICLAILLTLASVAAIAEGIDVSTMTDEELHAIINAARNELTKRELVAAGDLVVVDQDDVQIYMTGNNEMKAFDDGGVWLYIEFVVVNNTDTTVNPFVGKSIVNGWDVHGDGMGKTSAGSRQKVTMRMRVSDGEVSSMEDIEEIVVSFELYDSDNSEMISKTEPVTIHFND